MALPQELLLYAENFYRRFPEEFMALGAPGLEEVFDLRPSGSWSRRVLETSTEKTVEITLRRWSQPSLGLATPCAQAPMGYPPMGYPPMGYPPQACAYAAYQQQMLQHAQSQAFSSYSSFGPASAAPATASNAPAASAEDQAAAMRLQRLESALSSLKPQIEALLTVQSAPQAAQTAPDPASRPPNSVPKASGALRIDTGTTKSTPASSAAAGAAKQGHRNEVQLQIQTKKEPERSANPKIITRAVTTGALDIGTLQSAPGTLQNRASGSHERPTVNTKQRIQAMGGDEPASPHSPGRFSVWK